MPTVTLPPKQNGGTKESFPDVRSFVIVGANGSGKTRLGVQIETDLMEKAHRISAHRALTIPRTISPVAIEDAERKLLYGQTNNSWTRTNDVSNRPYNRWSSAPATTLLNDFEPLLQLLFANDAKRNREYVQAARSKLPDLSPPKSKIEHLIEIMGNLMPYRAFGLHDEKIVAKSNNGIDFRGTDMSDGERAAIYLIGQVLCAPENSVLIIDEPELHLHRAIQSQLWDQLEANRMDCTFVYITHDLDFATSRIEAKQIWVKSFDGTNWDWEEIQSVDAIPDPMLLLILGSRKPIIFVEGKDKSLDMRLYSVLYPDSLIVPCGSCEKVIEATKALQVHSKLHHFEVRGFIDGDRRSDQHASELKKYNIFTSTVAILEHVMCLPDVNHIFSELKGTSQKEALDSIKKMVSGQFSRHIEEQALQHAISEIQYRLIAFGPKAGKEELSLEQQLQNHVNKFNVTDIISKYRKLFTDAASHNEYLSILRYYNNRGLRAMVATLLGMNPKSYEDIVVKRLKDEPNGEPATAIRNAIEGVAPIRKNS